MVTENTTPNRGYPEPAVGNTLEVDVGRLIAALRAIDVDVANALAAIVSKAGLASPAFTGTPTAPTAAPGTDSGQLATTAFVKAAFNALVDSAPGALDTLNELAAAIGDDPNFAATMAALIGTKADAAATTAALALKADASALAGKLDKSGGVMTGSIQDAVLAPSAAPTKRLGFNLAAITAGQKRDIIMPDRDVDLAGLGLREIAAASLSGTAQDLSFPSTTKLIDISISGLRSSTGSNPVFQLVDSGGPETTGAIGGVSDMTATSAATASLTSNINITGSNTSSSVYTVGATFRKHAGNKWVITLWAGRTDSGAQKTTLTVSEKELSDVLTGVRLTFANGTDTFQAGGTISARYWTA
ncbi:hypothetical protein [Shinella sumterensis]|uniref:hypothetical protein n=1 Tax=Shinella sumterensis TaxID=1967501 RepID=UPI001AD9A106|nr:hypothetical protein [Shinella sumterensis]